MSVEEPTGPKEAHQGAIIAPFPNPQKSRFGAQITATKNTFFIEYSPVHSFKILSKLQPVGIEVSESNYDDHNPQSTPSSVLAIAIARPNSARQSSRPVPDPTLVPGRGGEAEPIDGRDRRDRVGLGHAESLDSMDGRAPDKESGGLRNRPFRPGGRIGVNRAKLSLPEGLSPFSDHHTLWVTDASRTPGRSRAIPQVGFSQRPPKVHWEVENITPYRRGTKPEWVIQALTTRTPSPCVPPSPSLARSLEWNSTPKCLARPWACVSGSRATDDSSE